MFNKFPKLKYLQGDIYTGRVVIEEKLDGANAGIILTSAGLLQTHSRNRILWTEGEAIDDSTGAFRPFCVQVSARAEQLRALMTREGVTHIHGEWLIRHSLEYPAAMFDQFYAFDVRDASGHFQRVSETLAADLDALGFRTVKGTVHQGTFTDASLAAHAQKLQEHVGRRIEGVVMKLHGPEAVDEDGERRIWKHVLPEFKETHRRDWANAEGNSPEARLVAHLPPRTIEKRVADIAAINGGWHPSQIPRVMDAVWRDFVGEFLADALKKGGMPTVDTGALRKLVQQRTKRQLTEMNYL